MKKLAEATDTTLELETQQKETSSIGIKRKIKPAADMLFFARGDQFAQGLKATGNYNRWHTTNSCLRIFKEFLFGTEAVWDELPERARRRIKAHHPGLFSGSDLPFQRIDVALLERFKVYLKAHRRVSDRTIANYLVTIQCVFIQAIREGVLDRKHSPFGKDKVRIKIPDSKKVGLTQEDVQKLEAAELLNPAYSLVRDLWLVSFYFAGMRAADVIQLRWSDLRDGRLHYVMGKNKKSVPLKIPEKALHVLKRHEPGKKHPDDFVFPYLNDFPRLDDEFSLKKRIAGIVGICNHLLGKHIAPAAQIEGRITMHVSRHTFATLAGDKIPIQMLQKLYRHSDIKTTLGYQSAFIHRDADDALDAVLGG